MAFGKKKKKPQFYRLDKILKTDAKYMMIIGERSNGKTFAALEYGIEQYVKHHKQMAILRRWDEDFKGKRGQAMFNSIENEHVIEKLTQGEWTSVRYYASKWYLCRYEPVYNDEGVEIDRRRIQDEEPFCYGFSISSQEHDKSSSYPNITTIVFDEFLTRTAYLTDEFVLFTNSLSTIIRQRTDVKIFMLGNTVNRYCPYFTEMGLKHVKDQKQGTIETYSYGESKLKVAVEYCAEMAKEDKPSNIYFAFDNPKLNMIKGGAWELDMYPHCPIKIRPKDIIFSYFIISPEDAILQCDIVCTGQHYFTFVHMKTTPLKDEEHDIIFCKKNDPRPNWRKDIQTPYDNIGQKIKKFFVDKKVFYQSNEVGEIVRNYLMN